MSSILQAALEVFRDPPGKGQVFRPLLWGEARQMVRKGILLSRLQVGDHRTCLGRQDGLAHVQIAGGSLSSRPLEDSRCRARAREARESPEKSASSRRVQGPCS